ncbi:MAG: hypothetical protein M9922_14560 [Microthrixaceae bacterium]|nr:hypothetical protein [Microthrixaceae bacterium]
MRTFLIGMLYSVQRGGLRLTNIWQVLTEDLSKTAQQRLRVQFSRPGDPPGPPRRTITYDHLSRLLCALAAKTAEDEHELLDRLANRLIEASTKDGLAATGDWAIDTTGIDAWSRGREAKPAEATSDASLNNEPDAPTDSPPATGLAETSDPDAAWGYRTATMNKGNSKKFFGYDLYGFVSVPPIGISGEEHPALIRRIELRPASSSEATTTIPALDALTESGLEVNKVIIDRGFSYKTANTWANQLRDRDIEQVLDMHPAERGRIDHHGIAMIDGWPHCPAISETLVEITRPKKLSVPRNDQDRSSAAAVAIDEFRAGITARDRYAFRRTSGWTTKKRSGERVERYECPAEAGQMRCPLKAHSMAYPDDVPAVLNPPDPATAPTCCSQRTVELGEDAQGKLRQEHRWGTDTWIKAYGRRTFVEGGFGVLRNPALGGLSRGLFCIIGRIKVTLWLAALVAATNIAALAHWATRTGVDSDDPALAPITDDDWAFEELDPNTTTGTDPPAAATPN